MNANLKIALALALLVAAVIGATVITQFSEGEPARPSGDGPGTGFRGGMPLVFKEFQLKYDPRGETYAARVFPGFFEVNKEIHWATYLLRNPNTVPVKVTAKARSCVACTTAQLAVLSPDENRAMRRDVGVAAAVGGLRPDPEVSLFRRAEDGNLTWQPLNFDQPDEALTVPAAVDPDTPTWCVLRLGFEVKGPGANTLHADIGLQAEGMTSPTIQKFLVSFVGDSAERASPSSYDYGVIGAKSEPKSVDLYYWSATRPQTAFAPPVVGGLEGDLFFSASAPVPLSADDLEELARRASTEQIAVRARGGYKFTVTLRRTVETPDGPRELDIGPVERVLTVSGSDGTTSGQKVQLTATVTGLVALASGTDINLGDFRGSTGTTAEFKLVSERPGVELEPVNTGTGEPRDRNPPGVTVAAVGKPVTENGQKRWTFQLTVAPDALLGAINGQLIVFRAKETGQMIRIPLKGNANGL